MYLYDEELYGKTKLTLYGTLTKKASRGICMK